MAKKLYYKIGEACRLLEIQPYVLRYWETEFSALSPEKSPSGQRTYSKRDIRIIGRIKELLYEEGYTIAGAKKKLEGELGPGEDLPAAAKKPDDKPAEPTAEKPRTTRKPARRAAPPTRSEPSAEVPAAKKSDAAPPAAAAPRDEKTAARVARLEKGVEQALAEARNILEILDSSAAKK